MATIALLINPSEIKATTLIDENVDEKLIRTVIEESQNIHVHPIIGTGIFNELKTQINAGTLTAFNTTLISTYLQPALKYWVLFEGIDVFTYKFMNKSVVKRNGENSNAIDVDELRRLQDRFRDKAEWYSERATKYLQENEASFPLYYNPGSGIYTIYPKATNYSTGIFLGDSLKSNDEPDCECWQKYP